jgi:hypothetical protein
MDWVKAITELLKALAHFAWPVLVGLIVWWFRREIRTEIASLIARISKLKGPGVEIEVREQVKLSLENAKAGIPEEKIQEVKNQVETFLLEPFTKYASPDSANVKYLKRLYLLMEDATADPRNAIKRSWELLGGAVLRAAKVSGENVVPDSEEISTSLKRLEGDTQYSHDLIRSIRNLQQIARKVFYQSQWAYDPSPKEAEEFVLYAAAVRKDLGEKVE